VKIDFYRLLLRLAAFYGWDIQILDVEAAFLYSEIDYDIYVELPSGFGDSSKYVCILLKLLYGLKQAPRI
jgi:hypothetical protein